MKRFIILLAAVAVFAALPSAAFAQDHSEKNSPKAEFQISKALVVGATTLKPGSYRFQCVFENGKHFLVVWSDEGQELARVPCAPEDLTKKVDTSDFRSITRPDGVQVLTAVRIKGEKVAHRLADTD